MSEARNSTSGRTGCWPPFLPRSEPARSCGLNAAITTPALKPVPELFALGLFIPCLCIQAPLMLEQPADLSAHAQIALDHERVMRQVVLENPGAKWISSRSSLSLVRQGVALEQDWCTMQVAFANRRAFSPDTLIRRLAQGEYRLLHLTETYCEFDRNLDGVINGCFTQIATSTVNILERSYPVRILRYDSLRPECIPYLRNLSGH